MSQYSICPVITATSDMDNNGLSGYNYFLIDCSGGNITITLPSSIWDGLTYVFLRTDLSANVLTFNAHSGAINGGSSLTMSPKNYCEFVYFNGDWIAPKITYL